MAKTNSNLSTGLVGLDRVLNGVVPGDNIVWQVDRVEDYAAFIEPCRRAAAKQGQKLIYFRFARHRPLISDGNGVEVHVLDPQQGFETAVTEIHKVIDSVGSGGFYLFDCLTELATDWYSDRMLGNFFLLTCPYLSQRGAIAYFALLRNHHSFHATSAIADVTQVLLDVYRKQDRTYIHPLKVQGRYSATMNMLYAWEGQEFRPITESAIISEIMTSVPWARLASLQYQPGVWGREILRAEEVAAAVSRGEMSSEDADPNLDRLLHMAISRDRRVLKLAKKYLTLDDVLEVSKRMIGTGLIGGKSVGMLLARAALRKSSTEWAQRMEAHDSFFIGSDVFYTYLVQNGLWWARERQKDPDRFLEDAEDARRQMLDGKFPDYICTQFRDMLDYFGQSPFIVRSSSLLEDNFGNAFAGKYESVFCANQGSRGQRLEAFLSAIRTVYASSMSEVALRYRAQRGLLHLDEQMAVLVQRVSGARYGKSLYYPQIAGVGFSFNPYAWSRQIDPRAGMLRLVFGLGTRAVDRRDDDYTRLVSLNAPDRRPETNFDEVRQYSQHKVDVIDLESNRLVSDNFPAVAKASPSLPIERFASRDEPLLRRAAETGLADVFGWVITFDDLFSETDFIPEMRDMLQTLQEAYACPVDVEFTTNFLRDGSYKINILQCRPLQVNEGGKIVAPPDDIAAEDVIVEVHGAVIGQSRMTDVDRIIYVIPSEYGQLPATDQYTIARLIGRIVHLDAGQPPPTQMLLGPGRWGTTMPSLGVPVRFAELDRVSLLCEIVAMRDGLVPDVSLGTHFFCDLVEADILYFALYPGREENVLNRDFLEGADNRLAELLPEAAKWEHVIRVIDGADLSDDATFHINANTLTQRVVCYVEHNGHHREQE